MAEDSSALREASGCSTERHSRPPGANENGSALAELTIERILAWADAHRAAQGRWPTQRSGKVPGSNGERWARICTDLSRGGRGLPGGQSLGGLLITHRGARICNHLPRLSVAQILDWADAYYAAQGVWPGFKSGPVEAAPGEIWAWIDRALWLGQRGLPGGTTLTRLLNEHGRCGPRSRRPLLTEEQILAWADAHHAATGHWPNLRSGAVTGTRGEKWAAINDALKGETAACGGAQRCSGCSPSSVGSSIA
jgi:hypothetical protein